MIRTGAACGLLAAFFSACGSPCAADPPGVGRRVEYRAGKVIAQLKSRAVSESSGVACSRLGDGMFFTHNDSGDGPILFAFNQDGDLLAVIGVRGARNQDWEDLASFRLHERAWLVIADTGDNARRRRVVTLYFLPEPKIDPAKRGVKMKADLSTALAYSYPDGPQDCECVAVDTTTRKLYLSSKRGDRKLYELPLPELPPAETPDDGEPAEPVRAKLIAALAIPQTTAMDISPDGRRAVLLTYLGAYEYARGKEEGWAKAFRREPKRVALPLLRQAEGICYGPDGKTLYGTSEGVPMPLVEARPEEE
jgi:hypothetical protein